MTDYLIGLLKENCQIAYLSRGYKRATVGYFLADNESDASTIGDEPLEIKRRHPEVAVAVCENRVLAIPKLLGDAPKTNVVILDDAFQHLSIKPGLSILMTEYNDLFTRDFLLPVGRLREWRMGYKRAKLIIVNKCPLDLSEEQRRMVIAEIKPYPHQKVFFSSIGYSEIYPLLKPDIVFDNWYDHITLDDKVSALAVCGIAKPAYIEEYLKTKTKESALLKFPDHHVFELEDLGDIKSAFEDLNGEKKIIVTTAKDSVRLEKYYNWFIEQSIPLFCLPMSVEFSPVDKSRFDQEIMNFMGLSESKI